MERLLATVDRTISDESDKGNVIKLPDITCWFTDRLALNQKVYDLLATS